MDNIDEKSTALLDQIKKCLDQYGIEYEVRNDRAEGPYINIGDIRRRSRRAQFWIDPKTGSVKFWVGLDMEKMYYMAAYSKYRASWDTEKTKEIHLIFPYLFPAMEYIRMIAGSSSNEQL